MWGLSAAELSLSGDQSEPVTLDYRWKHTVALATGFATFASHEMVYVSL
jgi:hypothetical protein